MRSRTHNQVAPLKIAYVLNTYPQPSHSFIRRELQALERQGFDVLRLAMRRSEMDLVDARDRAEADRTEYVLDRGGFGLVTALLRRFVHSPGKSLHAFRLAWRCGRAGTSGVLRHMIYLCEAAQVVHRCEEEAAKHIHAHFGTNSATVAMLAHALGGPGYSFTVHGPEEFDAPIALSLGDKLANARFAVGVSQFGRSQLSRWVSSSAWDKLHVVHCGIEPSAFDQVAPLSEGPIRLVAIGRFVEQKGQMVLIRAMARLRETHPEIHLSLVGDGEMRDELEQAIAQNGLQDQVTLTGWLDQEGVRATLDAAHALVMPSFAEGLPMVIMEAMAAARPVIATYIAGAPELVLDGQTGWLVPAGDEEALAGAMVRLSETSRETLLQMGQAGRDRVLRRHDIDTEADKLVRLIRDAG